MVRRYFLQIYYWFNRASFLGGDWGTCDGACGEVEHFRACSDISITGSVVTNNTTQPHPTHTPSTPPAPTTPQQTTTQTTPPPGTSCKAIGAWEGDSKQDAWCTENCFHDPPYCPEDVCQCLQEFKQQLNRICRATGEDSLVFNFPPQFSNLRSLDRQPCCQ